MSARAVSTRLKSRIHAAQVKAAVVVNAELVLLYWSIGRDIIERQTKEGWGAQVIDRLSADLRRHFPEMKDFSPRNLKYMRAFAHASPAESIVQQVAAQLIRLAMRDIEADEIFCQEAEGRTWVRRGEVRRRRREQRAPPPPLDRYKH